MIADPVYERSDPRVAGADAPVVSAAATRTAAVRSTGAADAPARERLLRSASDIGTGAAVFQRLPFAAREARTIISLAPPRTSRASLGFDASRRTAMSEELRQYKVLHFATHALVNNERPELSGLVLSLVDRRGRPQNGFLELQDIYNLQLKADLVVLASCESGIGKEVKGEGMVALARGFMYAGASRVVASLWKVDDAATAELMQQFYAGMLTGGLSPPAALRAAQVKMMRQPRWSSPFYWAGFEIQGDWR